MIVVEFHSLSDIEPELSALSELRLDYTSVFRYNGPHCWVQDYLHIQGITPSNYLLRLSLPVPQQVGRDTYFQEIYQQLKDKWPHMAIRKGVVSNSQTVLVGDLV